ncbi:MAG: chromosomal replication initiator protein DnaA [Clostridiales bacterium]|nr:chromosomal replication initiator protein DnaA [Clostridiales bacterium]MDY5514378.1 chromosomal replication initiator protein DnaA [Candidatus Ventricola sp.]
MDHVEIWDKAKALLREELADVSYKTWIDQPLKPVYVTDDKLALEVISEFTEKTVRTRYMLMITEAVSQVVGHEMTIELMSVSDRIAWQERQKKEEQTTLQGVNSFNPKSTFDTFVVGSSNRFAHAASLAVAEAPGVAYNPLFLYGGVGLGKTHLMHAIGHFIQEHFPNMRLLYLPSEMFTNELVIAIKNNKNVEFRSRFRNVDVLMLDDIQFIAGRDSTQEEFFHTFNALHSAGKQIIISSDKPPREIARLEERLRSRFEWGLVADIQKPDFDTRVAILRKKADNEGIEISYEMLEQIAGRIESNIRELEGSLTRVSAYARLNHCEINEEVIAHALKDIAVVRDPKRITPDVIIDCVAEYYGLSATQVRGDSRKKEIAQARHMAVYLTREMTGLSLPRIGDAFGRDHSTIINSCDKITKQLSSSEETKAAVADLKKIITEK